MGRDNHGQPVIDRQPPDHLQHLVDEFRIECGSRLVQQQDAWIGRERPGDSDPLLLAAGEMARQGIRAMAKTDTFEQFAGAPVGIDAGHAVYPAQRPCDILPGRQMTEQVELLKHHADADAGTLIGDRVRRQRFPVVAMSETAAADTHHAGIPIFQMVDAAQKRTFARSAGSEQRDHLADPDRQIEPVKYGLRTVIFAQIGDLDDDIVAFDHRGVPGPIHP